MYLEPRRGLKSSFILILVCLIVFLKSMFKFNFTIKIESTLSTPTNLKTQQKGPMAHRQWSQEQYWWRKRLIKVNFKYYYTVNNADLIMFKYTSDLNILNTELLSIKHTLSTEGNWKVDFTKLLFHTYILLSPQTDSNLVFKAQFSKPKTLTIL